MIIVLTAVIASTLPVTVAAVGGYRGRYEWCKICSFIKISIFLTFVVARWRG